MMLPSISGFSPSPNFRIVLATRATACERIYLYNNTLMNIMARHRSSQLGSYVEGTCLAMNKSKAIITVACEYYIIFTRPVSGEGQMFQFHTNVLGSI